jgi:hypothetical protein
MFFPENYNKLCDRILGMQGGGEEDCYVKNPSVAVSAIVLALVKSVVVSSLYVTEK